VRRAAAATANLMFRARASPSRPRECNRRIVGCENEVGHVSSRSLHSVPGEEYGQHTQSPRHGAFGRRNAPRSERRTPAIAFDVDVCTSLA